MSPMVFAAMIATMASIVAAAIFYPTGGFKGAAIVFVFVFGFTFPAQVMYQRHRNNKS